MVDRIFYKPRCNTLKRLFNSASNLIFSFFSKIHNSFAGMRTCFLFIIHILLKYTKTINSFNNLVCVVSRSLANFLNLIAVSVSKEMEEKEEGLLIFNHPFSRLVILFQCNPFKLVAGFSNL